MVRPICLLALAALTAATAADACRCVRQTPQVAYRQASAVMLGTVEQARDVSTYHRAYRITVDRSWKQRLRGRVAVNNERSSCLADLEPGYQYLVYVVRDPKGVMRTSACQGNQPASEATVALAWLARHR